MKNHIKVLRYEETDLNKIRKNISNRIPNPMLLLDIKPEEGDVGIVSGIYDKKFVWHNSIGWRLLSNKGSEIVESLTFCKLATKATLERFPELEEQFKPKTNAANITGNNTESTSSEESK